MGTHITNDFMIFGSRVTYLDIWITRCGSEYITLERLVEHVEPLSVSSSHGRHKHNKIGFMK